MMEFYLHVNIIYPLKRYTCFSCGAERWWIQLNLQQCFSRLNLLDWKEFN